MKQHHSTNGNSWAPVHFSLDAHSTSLTPSLSSSSSSSLSFSLSLSLSFSHPRPLSLSLSLSLSHLHFRARISAHPARCSHRAIMLCVTIHPSLPNYNTPDTWDQLSDPPWSHAALCFVRAMQVFNNI